LIGDPARSIDSLELDQSGGVTSSTTNNIKNARTTIGIDFEVDSVIASDVRVVVDIDCSDAVRCNRGRQVGKGEIANLNFATVSDVGLDPGTSLADNGPSDVVHCQQTVSTIAEERRLSSATNLSTNNDIEGYSVGSDCHQRLLRVGSTLQSDGYRAGVLGDAVCGVDHNVARQQTDCRGTEGGVQTECLTSSESQGCGNSTNLEVCIASQRDTVHSKTNVGRASDGDRSGHATDGGVGKCVWG